MNQEVERIFEDQQNNFYPSDEKAFEKLKCELTPGKKIYWHYQDDKTYADDNDFNIKDDPGYSGIIIPFPGITLTSENCDLEIEDCIVVVTSYPANMDYCESGWTSIMRLLDQKKLVEIFEMETELAQ